MRCILGVSFEGARARFMKSVADLSERLQLKVSQLNRAIFSRESGGAAKLYAELVEEVPDLVLRPVVQYDLARLLELGGDLELALKAFESVIQLGTETEYYPAALRQAGHICWRLQKMELAYEHLTAFLETNPSRAEKMDAEEILARVPPGARRISRVAAKLPPTARASSPDIRVPGKQPTPAVGPTAERAPRESKDPSVIILGGLDSPAAEAPARGGQRASNAGSLKLPPVPSAPMPARSAPVPAAAKHDRTEIFPAAAADIAVPPPPVRNAPSGAGRPAGVSPEFARADRPAPPPAERKSSAHVERPVSFESPPPPLPKSLKSREDATGPESRGSKGPAFRGISPAKMLGATPPESSSFGQPEGVALSPMAGEEPPERRYARLRGASFALIMPIGKRIHIEAVADLVAKNENLDEARAKTQVIGRKGIVYDQLSIDDVIDLWPLVRDCKQKLVFVHVDRTLRPYEMFDVLGAEALPPGLKMTTEKGIKKARWIDIKLIGAGTFNKLATLDVLSGVPLKHFRFQEGSFNFRTVVESARRDPHKGLMDFVQILCEQAPRAIRTHTLENLRATDAPRPQAFASEDEFNCYNRWQLFSHYAEVVDAGELSEQYKSMSNW